jgi:hypothetical protein
MAPARPEKPASAVKCRKTKTVELFFAAQSTKQGDSSTIFAEPFTPACTKI